jgi:hypothetical protein
VTLVRAYAKPQEMYNLEVARANSFSVGSSGWIVHNAGPPPNYGLPPRTSGQTHGVLNPTSTNPIDLVSGNYGKYSPGGKNFPGLTRGDAPVGKTTGGRDIEPQYNPSNNHAEGHAAAHMRNNDLTECHIVLNNRPCPRCDATLPRMLPPGARLRVEVPPGLDLEHGGLPFDKTYIGDP